MEIDLLAQIIGIAGFLCGISAYLSKNDTLLKFLIGVASLLMASHFFLLGAYVATGAASFAGIRSLLSIFQSVKPYAPIFFLAYIPLGYFCFVDWLDILPLIAGIIGTYAMFYQEKLPMRYGLLIGTFFWFAHNLLQGSIGGTLLEAFYIAANFRTICKIKKDGYANNDKRPISPQ